jgi:hypothetical protein
LSGKWMKAFIIYKSFTHCLHWFTKQLQTKATESCTSICELTLTDKNTVRMPIAMQRDLRQRRYAICGSDILLLYFQWLRHSAISDVIFSFRRI